MTASLGWDGLRVEIPAGMEPVILDRGFVRLAGPDLPVLDLRFGPEKAPFNPDKDGPRLLKASGIGDARLAPFRASWTRRLKGGVWAAPSAEPRLFVLHPTEKKAVVAALFSAPPQAILLRSVLESLDWTPPDTWRSWRCYDLRFETPSHSVLGKASFRPGSFRLEFSIARSTLVFERLAPASVLLAGEDLEAWLEKKILREHARGLSISSSDPTQARFADPASPWRRILAGLPFNPGQIRGGVRHDEAGNKILILTERGRLIPAPDFERTFSAYATISIQG
ncbi:MAG: hypothetical protein KUA37_08005 [Desulfomicrobium sp.]|nr:hypothetical protein [Pseudomonadota bacterium]MBV1711935.1 hypothetical protein [Desulfomicrobium sp.]MBU4571112.1 hypothetical protein [Pseudomonadota bacterium]MBU4593741.1 hypothetical protein [Pseudomonadota bacterium]MBV1719003.1 hypothetical protein [Desulfomicrobium sp.]